MNEDSTQYLQRLKENLPVGKDPTVVILRGHLFVEELLDEIITVALKDASAIQAARLTFFQKLCLAQGVLGLEKNCFMWKPFKDLNKLRNDISHKLPDATLSKKLDTLLRTFFEDDFFEIPNNLYSKSKALRKGIISQCAILFGFISGMKSAISSNRNKGLGRIR